MSIKPVQNQFNGGEISPHMEGRFDLPAYQYSAAIMQNFIPISEGCFKRRGGTNFVATGKAVTALLFKIVPTPSNATVVINGNVTKEVYCAPGDLVSYEVSAADYKTQVGTYTVEQDVNLPIVLVSSVIQYTVTINATPSDAVVYIDGLQRNQAIVGANSNVQWSVSKAGYQTQNGVITNIDRNTSKSVALKMRFAISAIPSDATVTMNGVVRKYIDVNPNTVVNWSVAKSGYQTQSGSQTVTASLDKIVRLSSQAIGQVMFDSSTAGEYQLELEAGRYELLMCGAGGNGYSKGTVNYWCWGGGSGSVFKGVISLSQKTTYNIQVGAPFLHYETSFSPASAASKFDEYITAGGGFGGEASDSTGLVGNSGGILVIHNYNIVANTEIASNGNDGVFDVTRGEDVSIAYAPLPPEYQNSYGFGGKALTSGRGVIGGNAYVKLVYLGE